MVIAGSHRPESKASFTARAWGGGRRRRRGGGGGKYVLHPLPLVLESGADKIHIKNQFMH